MAIPFLTIIMGFLVNVFTKIFTFKSNELRFDNVKKSAGYSLMVITFIFIISILYLIGITKLFFMIHRIGLLLIQSFLYIFITVIAILAALHNKESLQSLGLTTVNLRKSSALGLILGILFFVICQLISGFEKVTSILSVASLISLIEFIFVGFGEEIVFRGYFQTRMIAWLGKNKGLIITTFIFSYMHLTVNIVVKGYNMHDAIFECFKLIPLSLLLGYIMIKTKNVTSVSILHTLIDYTIN